MQAVRDNNSGAEYYWNAVTNETVGSVGELPPPLPPYWREAFDGAQQRPYYWNARSREVRWERPVTTSDALDAQEQSSWLRRAFWAIVLDEPADKPSIRRDSRCKVALGSAAVDQLDMLESGSGLAGSLERASSLGATTAPRPPPQASFSTVI